MPENSAISKRDRVLGYSIFSTHSSGIQRAFFIIESLLVSTDLSGFSMSEDNH